MVLNINKPLGLTSYDIIRQLKKRFPNQKIGHAGTLDPLAEGVLICLVGKEDTKRQAEFMGHTKEYTFDVLFGFETDTYDVLGLPKFKPYDIEFIKSRLNNEMKNFLGEIDQAVPAFSAVKIGGQTLYRLTLAGEKKENPVRKVLIEEIELLEESIIEKDILLKLILDLLLRVRKGFRQEKIVNAWNELFKEIHQEKFLMVKIKARVSKGTYVRSIAHDLGSVFNCGACTTVITRTKIGTFEIEQSISDIMSI